MWGAGERSGAGWGATRVITAVISVGLAVGVAACGYGFGGTTLPIPKQARTISIDLFTNRTNERGIEVSLQQAIEAEFRRRGSLSVVSGPEGDLVLTGVIRRLSSAPIGFSASSEALQFRSTITAGVRLRERSSKRLLVSVRSLTETVDFGATGGVVVTTSPNYQRTSTMNARDLVTMTNVQVGEATHRESQKELLDRLARDVYFRTMEGF
jgi:hypothetical protein